MKRSQRASIAQQTVDIVERGSYAAPGGRQVDISAAVDACLARTAYFKPDALQRLCDEVLAQPSPGFSTRITVVNETTLVGIARLVSESRQPVAALNFASAKNPGGGFLNGSQAQEESLARSSALYASLQRAPEYYERHRAMSSPIYSDAMIYSPGCPIIRNDDGDLLETPYVASFITSPAPNAGAAANNAPSELTRIPDVLRHRGELILALAASRGYRNLVLGAWGCGVFRNNPATVAAAFGDHLRRGAWADRFDCVLFSVLDTSPAGETVAAFQREFT